MIDIWSFGIGAGVGSIVMLIIAFAMIAISTIRNDKWMEREIRKAHDRGYAHGRKWHDKEIEWAEIEMECIKTALRKIGRNESQK